METKKTREGIPMSEESLREYNQTWKDMEDCFKEISGNLGEISAKKKVKNEK